MIIATPKPVREIASYIENYGKVTLVGCAGCTSVCMTGGKTQVETLAAELREWRHNQGNPLDTVVTLIPRQCEREFVDRLKDKVEQSEAVISLGCGVGVQLLAEIYSDKWVLPALNTSFAGATVHPGRWEERCGLCGDCTLHLTGGVCPIVRCAKSILNGPCGGSQRGKCELGDDITCAWHLIYQRLAALDRLDLMMTFRPPKNWSHSRSGGPRKFTPRGVE